MVNHRPAEQLDTLAVLGRCLSASGGKAVGFLLRDVYIRVLIVCNLC
jgi:hypothetical protein